MEQPLRERRRLHDVHAPRAGRLAEDRDAPRVTAEGRDVLLHPLQDRDVIEDRVVARRVLGRFGRQLRMRKKPERAEPVVRRHDDDAFSGEGGAVVGRRRAGAARPGAAVDPDHHRPLVAARGGGPHVQVEAVFARRRRLRGVRRTGRIRLLHALRAERVGMPDARPRRDRLRRLPAQIADRRRREGNALVDAHAVLGGTGDLPAVNRDRLRSCGGYRGPRTGGESEQDPKVLLPWLHFVHLHQRMMPRAPSLAARASSASLTFSSG